MDIPVLMKMKDHFTPIPTDDSPKIIKPGPAETCEHTPSAPSTQGWITALTTHCYCAPSKLIPQFDVSLIIDVGSDTLDVG